MQTYLLKWRGTLLISKVHANTLTEAKYKFCQSQGVNPILTSDRIQRVLKNYLECDIKNEVK